MFNVENTLEDYKLTISTCCPYDHTPSIENRVVYIISKRYLIKFHFCGGYIIHLSFFFLTEKDLYHFIINQSTDTRRYINVKVETS
jgi:hypothetical protein